MNEVQKAENAAKLAQFENVAQNALHRIAALEEAGPAFVRLIADLQTYLGDAEFPRLVDSYKTENGREAFEFSCPTCGHDVDSLKPANILGVLGEASFELAEDAAPGETLGYVFDVTFQGGTVVDEIAYWVHAPESGKPHAVELPTTWEVV